MLRIEDLKVAYGEKEVLKGLNLEFANASINGVMGYNGAGKTTLFNTLYGWVTPKAGAIHWNGQPLRRTSLGFLETNSFFYPYMLGSEYLRLIKNAPAEMQRWAKLFDLPLSERVDQYSTGMKKKLALAGLLMLDPELLLLDEPFSGVDIENNEKIGLILQKWKARQKTILIASHSIHHLMHLCDRISLLEEGVIVQTFEKERFPDLQQLFHSRIEQSLDHFEEES